MYFSHPVYFSLPVPLLQEQCLRGESSVVGNALVRDSRGPGGAAAAAAEEEEEEEEDEELLAAQAIRAMGLLMCVAL